MRLDKKLVILFPEKTRSSLEKYITLGKILVNGNPICKKGYEVKESDNITLDEQTTEISRNLFQNHISPIEKSWILFEDTDMLVLNKPKGISVHPSASSKNEITLIDRVLAYANIESEIGDTRPGIVHRLDKDTTGVLIIAKNKVFHEYLSKEIRERRVGKWYKALICGHPQSGDIIAPLKNNPQTKKMAIRRGGKESQTRFIIKEYFDEFAVSLADIELLTGRTHQIRAHFAGIGHPIVGDTVYGSHLTNKTFAQQFLIHSQVLHAYEYSFTDANGKKRVFQAPIPTPLLAEKGNPLRKE